MNDILIYRDSFQLTDDSKEEIINNGYIIFNTLNNYTIITIYNKISELELFKFEIKDTIIKNVNNRIY